MRGTNISTGGSATRIDGPPRELRTNGRNGTSQGLRVRASALLNAAQSAGSNEVIIEYSGRLNVAGNSQIRIENIWSAGVNIWTEPTGSGNAFTQTVTLTLNQLQQAVNAGTGDITLGATPGTAELTITSVRIFVRPSIYE
jgi:hypothetical protein